MSTTAMNGTGAEQYAPPDPTEENDLFDELLTRVPEFRAHLGALDQKIDQERERHQAVMNEIAERKRKVMALLKALGEDTAPAKKVGRPRGRSAGSLLAPGVPNSVLLPIIEGILALEEEGFFTVLGLMEDLGGDWAESQMYTAIKFLREQQFVGLKSPGRPGERSVYRKLSQEIGLQLREQLLAKMAAKQEPGLSRTASQNEIRRTVEAMRAHPSAEFAAADIAERMGHRSPKTVYKVIRTMKASLPPMLEEVGMAKDGQGKLSRTTYRLTEAADALS